MGGFRDAVAAPGLGAVAEIKRRSPSTGDLRPDADPAALAPAYEAAGAAAVSVLVDERFGGTWDDLRAARAASGVPLLAKGFFSPGSDLRTASEAGADAVLLLLRDLDDASAAMFLAGATLMRAPDPAARLGELLRRPLVKICGLTRDEDVAAAAEAGADLAGFVLAESPRRTEAPLPVPDTMLSVGVYVGEARDDGTDLVQLYASENGHRARDGVLLRAGEPVARVLDLPWLGQDATHWSRAAGVDGRVVLAGRLGPENVREAIAAVRPWAVDASRSLEAEPGIKEHAKVRAFVEAVA